MSDIMWAVAVGVWMSTQVGMIAIVMPVVVRELREIRRALTDAGEKLPMKTTDKSRAHSVITPYVEDRRIGKR